MTMINAVVSWSVTVRGDLLGTDSGCEHRGGWKAQIPEHRGSSHALLFV